jgi:ATP-dependent Clp protease, protease subunit
MSSAERMIKQIESEVAIGISILDAGEKRGYLTGDDLDKLNRIEGSLLPKWERAYTIAARLEGKQVRDRLEMHPDVLARKGLHISTAGPRKELYLYGPIGDGFGGVSADEIRAQLANFNSNEEIDFHVHSPGGSFREAVAIHSLIKNRLGKVRGYVDGSAASAGSLVLMACHDITMAPASEMMIHFASLENSGSMLEEDLARALKAIQDTNNKLVELYLPRWKGTERELRAALTAETFFTAREAVERGLADFVSESVRIAAYEVVTGSCRTPGFSIAASDGPHKRFRTRRAGLKIWQLEVDEMRRELQRSSRS